MNDETRRAKDRDRKRWKYHFEKAISLKLIPHVLMSEQEIRDMIIEHKKARGRPTTPDGERAENGPEPTEKQGTTISEFYRLKRAHELNKDNKWNKELANIREAHKRGSYSERNERIRWGESSLIFGIISPKTRTFPMKSDSDQYTRDKKRKETKKSSWNF